jgi:hypothetical protein
MRLTTTDQIACAVSCGFFCLHNIAVAQMAVKPVLVAIKIA